MTLSRTALAIALASVLAAPAFAQAVTDPAPAAQDQTQTPVPDAGIKKTPDAPRPHHRVRHHHVHAVTTPAPTVRG